MAKRSVYPKITPGDRFYRLTVIDVAAPTVRTNGALRKCWQCRCECGGEIIVDQSRLRTGNTRSCGCLYRDSRQSCRVTHGQSGNATYRSWTAMKWRCLNPNNPYYSYYGGRGITVCERWRESFEDFLQDMRERPPGHSLDRIDNDGNYEPGNCRWVLPAMQTENRRVTIWVEWRGERIRLTEAIRRSGISKDAVRSRLKLGWSLDDALSVPVKPYKKRSS